MRRTCISILAATAALTLTGCSNSEAGSDKPSAPSPAVTAGSVSDASHARKIAACAAAIAAAKHDSADSSLPECAKLPPEDYLKAIQDANKQ
ncbi:hypothetical protein ABZ876_31040 [Streptomyces sp. NPDC046931]|uniref:hypothetical protein n=1 Tax=Streptomyces sp. NPDC046931 TaxID=3154806 RepID=UPI0033C1BD05